MVPDYSKKNICMIAFRPLPKFFNRLKIANALYAYEYNINFICPIDGDQKKIEIIDGIKILRVDSPFEKRTNYVLLLKDYLVFIVKTLRLVSKSNQDIGYSYFHIHTPPDFLVFIAFYYKIMGKSKIILDLHDMLPEAVASNLEVNEKHVIYKFAELIEKISIKLSDAVICTNSYDKQIILSRNNMDVNKIFTIMNIPDLDLYRMTSANKADFGLNDKYVILFEGTIWKRRGLQVLIEAVNILRNQLNIHLLVVGDGPYLDSLKEMAQNMNIGSYITFTGWVDPNKLSKYVSASDLGIIPFLRTKVNERGVPNKLFEYIIHGKPVIASRLKGMNSVFDDDEIIFFEPGNPLDLAEKIKWCFDNEDLVKEKVKKARSRYEQEYTWDKMKKELYRCYNSL